MERLTLEECHQQEVWVKVRKYNGWGFYVGLFGFYKITYQGDLRGKGSDLRFGIMLFNSQAGLETPEEMLDRRFAEAEQGK